MRNRQHDTESPLAEQSVTFGPFRLTEAPLQLWQGQQLISLQPRPLAVLQYFVTHPQTLVSNDALRQAVWGRTIVSPTTVQVCVREVRKALGEHGNTAQYIETVGREGYRFIAPLTTPLRQGSGAGDQESGQTSQSEIERLSAHAVLPPVPGPRPPAPLLVGRDAELTHLHQLLAKAQAGERQIVFITGEAGIGKTTVVDAFLQSLTSSAQSLEEQQQRAGSREHGAKQTPPSSAPSSLLPAPCFARGQCIEHYGEGEPYLPVFEAIAQLCQGPQGTEVLAMIRQYAPTWLLHLPGFISAEEREGLHRRGAGVTQGQMMREMAEVLEAISRTHPVILVLEDLHVSDPSTVELLSYLAQRRSFARLLVLGTYRPIDIVLNNHPIRECAHALIARGYAQNLALELLSETDIITYLQHRLAAEELPASLAQQVYQRTDGNALFVLSTVEYLLAQQRLIMAEGQWQITSDLSSDDIPRTLRQLLLAQFDSLPAAQRQVLDAAGVAGTSFTVASVAAGVQADLTVIEDICEGLARGPFIEAHGIARWPDSTASEQYSFRHVLYQEVLYQHLSAGRRARLHLAIGTREEIGYGAQAKERAAELARHFTEGRDIPRALQYTVHAGRTALARGAHIEAERIFTHGLTLLTAQPDNQEWREHELWLQMGLTTALMATKGVAAPEVEQALQRAHTLCHQLGERPELFPVVLGLWAFAFIRGELSITRSLAEQTLRMADELADQSSFAQAHNVMLTTLYFQGELAAARVYGEHAMAIIDTIRIPPPEFSGGFDLEERTLNNLALVLLALGYPDQALEQTRTALAHADTVGHLQTKAATLQFLTGVQSGRREWQDVQTHASALVAFATTHHLSYWWAQGTINYGIALTQQGELDEGIAQIQQGLAVYRMTGAGLGITRILGWLAEARGLAGQIEEGLATLDEALQIAERNDERIWEAELYRRYGELLLAQEGKRHNAKGITQKEARDWRLETSSSSPQAPSLKPLAPKEVELEVERCFLKAIAIARQQQAKAWELRAVMSLVRLRQQQAVEQGAESRGQKVTSKQLGVSSTEQEVQTLLTEDHQMLSEVYGWFTEGFATADLQEAKALLTDLGGNGERDKG